jgi:hypothetical protein
MAAVFVASAGFAATLPLQEQLLALTPDPVRGQVQGVESAGRMTWQGIGAATAGAVAQHLTPGATITALAGVSVAITVVSRPFVVRARAVRIEETDRRGRATRGTSLTGEMPRPDRPTR